MLFTNQRNLRARALRETVQLIHNDISEDEYGVQAKGEDVCLGHFPAAVRLRFVPGRFEKIIWRGSELSVDSIEDEGQRGRWLRVYASRRSKV